jgi:leucyl aminopeptidase
LPLTTEVVALPGTGPGVPVPDAATPGAAVTDTPVTGAAVTGAAVTGAAVTGAAVTGGAAPVIVVPVEPGDPPAVDPALDDLLPGGAAAAIAAYKLAGQPGESAQALAMVAGQAVTVLLLGVGDRSPRSLRRAGAELGRRMSGGGTATASVVTAGDPAGLTAFAEGVLLGGYRFELRSGPPPGPPGVVALLVGDEAAAQPSLHRAGVLASAVALARDLANTPSAGKTPKWLAQEAVRVTAGHGVTARVWEPAELAAAGFGGILAVGSGSARPPRLIELSYTPEQAAPDARHVVLVGKGITFDSGGLSLKPNDGMIAMKTDMSGGATVIAVLSALARLGVRHRVTGLVAAAENMPSGSAYRPGDVITQYGGRTVEVLNTDAEGRLVLADALAYAAACLRPDQLIDIATLTGAARVALGTTHAPLYATHEDLAAELIAAGEATGDRVWRMPLEDSYVPGLDSDVADIRHIARDEFPAGSITAALFLRGFAGGVPWAHLDIAGTGRSAETSGELSKGATGFGTRLLLDLLSR